MTSKFLTYNFLSGVTAAILQPPRVFIGFDEPTIKFPLSLGMWLKFSKRLKMPPKKSKIRRSTRPVDLLKYLKKKTPDWKQKASESLFQELLKHEKS